MKSGFLFSRNNNNNKTTTQKSHFGFQKPNSESFSLHSCHKMFQYTSTTSYLPFSADPKQESSVIIFPKSVILTPHAKRMQFQGSLGLINQ